MSAPVRARATPSVLASPQLNAARHLIIERTRNAGLPAIYQFPETAEEGGPIRAPGVLCGPLLVRGVAGTSVQHQPECEEERIAEGGKTKNH
jgi:hypothetical protein